jgi:hypothetical protein
MLHEKSLPLADSVLLGCCDFHCGEFSSRIIQGQLEGPTGPNFWILNRVKREGEAMGMGKTKKRLDKGREARRLARSAAAPPAATKVVPDKRKKPEKHKKKWVQEGQ